MIYELITPPSVEPFTLSDLKEALRIDHSQDDALVMQLGQAARRQIERRLSHAIADQVWQVTVSENFASPIALRPGVVRDVQAIEASYGDAAPVALTEWSLRRGFPSGVTVTAPSSNGADALSLLQITFRTGRAEISTTPHDLIQAIHMLTAHYYENREAVSEGRYVAMPVGVETILQAFREMNI